MAWGVDEIYLAATERAMAWAASSSFAHLAYVVKDPVATCWAQSLHRHEVGKSGLLVLRGVGSPEGSQSGRTPGAVHWTGLLPDAGAAPADATVGAQLQAYITQVDMRGLDAPDTFRMWLRDLSHRLQQPVMFYTASTFGGSYDYDYALTYTPQERLHATRFDGLRPCSPTALQSGLACLSITLPTTFFALHERAFDWPSRALLR
ncbi:hypothetical protein [Stenotrophomonas sp. YAU14D1_LEIMI4_1]|uniref:hypothetical protein n=1 Tax=Stenotrophomonas sp. YAU14D1_LEIMI4_1 TaxID=2072407 RepID=UPI000D53D2A3|nr:hypothetical protein [Stenotrophomonas sp. YAU14D1_LEIMI4_1]AWH25804.1 hypothetical protein C1932_12250 [Stenotrophomonas sp. YAU14D1_LEIMI4_1]